jgi:hypothetical protein
VILHMSNWPILLSTKDSLNKQTGFYYLAFTTY